MTSNGRATRTPTQGRGFRRLEITLWLLVAGAFAYRVLPAQPIGEVSEDGVAPGFSVRTLDGGRVKLHDLRGQVVLVNFWATWCPPCRLEMPGFQAVYDDDHARGFTVVGLSTDVGSRRVVEDFVRARGITYPVAMASRELQRRYGGIEALPQSFLLDRRGRVRKRVVGIFSEAALRAAVDELLAEEAGS